MLDMATETEDPTPSKAKNCVKLKYVHFLDLQGINAHSD